MLPRYAEVRGRFVAVERLTEIDSQPDSVEQVCFVEMFLVNRQSLVLQRRSSWSRIATTTYTVGMSSRLVFGGAITHRFLGFHSGNRISSLCGVSNSGGVTTGTDVRRPCCWIEMP